MNTKSVRFHLSVWYSLAFFLAAAVIFGSFYLVTKQALYNQTDSAISSHAQKIADIITSKGGDMRQMMAREAFLQVFSDPGMVVILTDNSGNIIGSSFTITPKDKVVSALFEAAVSSGKPIFLNQTLGDTNLRFQADPISQNGQLRGVLMVGHPIDVIDKSLTNLFIMLAVVFIIFLIPTVIGGHLLAQSAMQPIVVISEKLKKISSQNLDERIATPDTDDEIKELAVTFNSLLDRLSQAFKRERQFISDIAHELKTPLATQRTNIEVTLSHKRSKEDYKKALAETLVDNNRISSTVKNILDLAWSEAENAKNQFETVDLSYLTEELKDIGMKMVFTKRIHISGTTESGIKVRGKRDKLFHALLNIVDNAVKYTHDNGTISITLRKTIDCAHLQIKDTGIGITKKDLPYVFERFYRGLKTDKAPGSGLGLAITKAIIAAHHGKIDVESTAGKGTTIKVSLPLA